MQYYNQCKSFVVILAVSPCRQLISFRTNYINGSSNLRWYFGLATTCRLKFNIFCHKYRILRANTQTHVKQIVDTFKMWRSHLNKRLLLHECVRCENFSSKQALAEMLWYFCNYVLERPISPWSVPQILSSQVWKCGKRRKFFEHCIIQSSFFTCRNPG